MDAQFWRQRWQENLIGWHLDEVHPALIRYFSRLRIKNGETIFIPLCGKSIDMAWLAQQGFQVVGVELSDRAINDFFSEQHMTPDHGVENGIDYYQAGNIKLFHADYFDLLPQHMKDVKAVYDRAALIALPKEGERGRKAYMQQMRQLFGPDIKILLITLDYDQQKMAGPPFSVSGEEVIYQYAFDHIIEFLSQEEILHQEDKFRQRGLESLKECVFMMTRYEPVYAAFSDLPQDF
ncbi:MAG: thiopurine S-methyltransferase [Gammaproteobacteria bacterium]|nr:MAG: thiopurine S-methyltransferase [Gammaproteobacteria bacterium]